MLELSDRYFSPQIKLVTNDVGAGFARILDNAIAVTLSNPPYLSNPPTSVKLPYRLQIMGEIRGRVLNREVIVYGGINLINPPLQGN
ncbi:MAG: hypothetical protein F6K14_16005 [Symploca sp. SIO2C1]|nr:hypothetical protein [Symploca sp. SIO2C1]